ncbi:MAG: hypothetical protein HY811_02390 [Planctomycetes bacterium]|nr:hypothetical protein [Planctomycetota bacterium]
MLKMNLLDLILLTVCCLVIGCRNSSQDLNRTEKRIKGNYEEEIKALTDERDRLKLQLKEELRINAEIKTELEELGGKLKELETELNNLENEPLKVKPKESPSSIKSISGEIRSVNKENNIVIISIGRKDMVYQGMKLEIYRGRKSIGKIEVDGVEEDWSTAQSIPAQDISLFQIGDSVKRPESE